MVNYKNKVAGSILILIILSALNQVKSQDSLNQLLNDSTKPTAQADSPIVAPTPFQQPPTGSPQPPVVEEKKKKRLHFFWVDEQKNEKREQHRKELKDLKNRQKEEIKNLKKNIETEKIQEAAFQKKVTEKQTEIMAVAQKEIYVRNKEIQEVKKSDNTIEVLSYEEDPLYIKKAEVLKSITSFIGIKDVEFKYKLELHNQTPKIINFVLISWERKLAFNDTQTLAKQIKVAKPITPYEKRIVEYNELNSRRDGETYQVKIVKIIFEDGTQWKNPAVKDTAL